MRLVPIYKIKIYSEETAFTMNCPAACQPSHESVESKWERFPRWVD
jgi:hypothetical protein